MTRYAALLRGINVGGRRSVKMADLRALLSDLGYADVTTLLQSGNAVFTAPDGLPDSLAAEIEARIAADLGLTVNVMIRTGEELRGVVERVPFEVRDPSKSAVAFLGGAVGHDQIAALDHAAFAPDEVVAGERELYLYYPNGMARSKLTPILERRLAVPFTVRNWNTTTKLLALVEER
jgi:uncharacterized protein (DUF1697 family)